MVIEKKFNKTHAIEPYHSCGLGGGFVGVQGVENCDFIIHGSSGCGFSMRYGLAQHWKSFVPAPTTNLCDQNVIFGGEKLLYSALEELVKLSNAELIVVLTSCSAEIIGEDYNKVCSAITKKYGRQVICIEGGGTTDLIGGYNKFLSGFVKHVVLDKEYNYESEKDSSTLQVDVAGIIPRYDMFWRGDIAEIERLLKLLGLEVNSFFVGKSNLQKIRKVKNTELLINVNHNVGKQAFQLLEREVSANIFTADLAPIGIKYTSMFLRKIAEKIGLDVDFVEQVIKREEAEAKKVMARGFDFTKIMYQAAKVAIIGEPTKVCPLVNFLLNEMGMCCKIIAFTSKASAKDIKELNEIVKTHEENIVVLNDVDNYYIKKELLQSGVNLVFGRSLDRIPELNAIHITWQFPSSDHFVMMDRPLLGYSGIATILDYVVNGFCGKWY